jgi:hypothetical protein
MRKSVPILRSAVCWTMIATFPAMLWAAESGGAMLYGKGTVWLNNGSLPRSSAIFPGDLIRTEREAVANINATHASVIIQTDSLVKYEGSAVSLEHGSVRVNASGAMAVRAVAVTVAPVSNAWTEFEVTDVDGTVQIFARKGSVNIGCGKETVTLPEGQQATREESGKCSQKKVGAYPPAAGDILANRYMLLGGGGVPACIFWLCVLSPGLPSEPMSPSKP